MQQQRINYVTLNIMLETKQSIFRICRLPCRKWEVLYNSTTILIIYPFLTIYFLEKNELGENY